MSRALTKQSIEPLKCGLRSVWGRAWHGASSSRFWAVQRQHFHSPCARSAVRFGKWRLSGFRCHVHGDTGRAAGGSDGISLAPALDTTAAVIILALPLPCESLPGPKSLKRITVLRQMRLRSRGSSRRAGLLFVRASACPIAFTRSK
jgi:hypothetical protein